MPVSPTAPPQFLETPPSVLEVLELESVTLRCVAHGSPQPHVTWKLQGKDLGQSQDQVQVSGPAGVRGEGGTRAGEQSGVKPRLGVGYWLY
jgi:hypothetical protein